MPPAHHINTPLPELLQAGGASQQAIDQLTPSARQATKGTLMHLWLRNDNEAHGHFGRAADNLSDSSRLNQQDINTILMAFENAYSSSAGIGRAMAPNGFFCNWSCCCTTPCCCCAAATAEPARAVV
jgi:hypothetical protein